MLILNQVEAIQVFVTLLELVVIVFNPQSPQLSRYTASAGKRVEMPKYDKCPRCKQVAVHLAMATIHRFYGDSDDQNGDESIFGDEEVTPEYGVSLFAHICFKCGYLDNVGIESPREKVLNTSTTD